MNQHTTFPTERTDRAAALARMVALCDKSAEIRRRTDALVDRLCPMPLLGWQSSLYPELNATPTVERMRAYDSARRRRDELHREIRPRIERKVRERVL